MIGWIKKLFRRKEANKPVPKRRELPLEKSESRTDKSDSEWDLRKKLIDVGLSLDEAMKLTQGVSNTQINLLMQASNDGRLRLFADLLKREKRSYCQKASSSRSDRRLKKNVAPIRGALRKLLTLRGVTFEWRLDEFPSLTADNRVRVGLIAQEVEEVLPEVVENDESGYKRIEYGHIVAVLVESIKEQQEQIDELGRRLSLLEMSNNATFDSQAA